MIQNASHTNELKKRKRSDNTDVKTHKIVNFTRPQCYSDEEELEKEVEDTDGQMRSLSIESEKDKKSM